MKQEIAEAQKHLEGMPTKVAAWSEEAEEHREGSRV